MNNQDINKTVELNLLFDHYKNTLTDKQKEYFELYFLEDLTLQEIADEFSVSRSAVFDSINKTVKSLNDLEDKLSILKFHKKIRKVLTNFKNDEISKNDFIKSIEEDL